MKDRYEKPVITKLHSSAMNKFGTNSFYSQKVRQSIDGVTIADLCENFGSPLFVYSERTIRRKYRQLESAFATRYPHVTMGWSYKTNYLKAICAVMHSEGAYAEIVSRMEYDKAKALGIPGDRIIFNGPHKPIEVLEEAIKNRVRINVDHWDEIEDLEKIAEKLDRPVTFGIRINLDAGIYPQWSRFGFNLESGQAMDAVRRITQNPKLQLDGVHCHIGTYILEPGAYARQVEKMVAFGYEVEDRYGFRMDYIDIGGGMPSRCKLKGTYLPPDVTVPSVDEYAEEVCDALHRSLRPNHKPELILENGRALIDDAGYLVTSVVAAKRLPDSTRAYVVDAGINLLFTSFWYKYNIEIDGEVSGLNEPAVIYGPMCMNIDVLDEGIQLPPLSRGNRLILSPVGAYNNTQWLQFIEYRPNVVMISEDGIPEIIRQSEDLSDIERRDQMPDRFSVS